MEVQKILISSNTRYILTHNGKPIIAAVKYLKHLDNIGKSPNTLRTYCYALKNYFEYLSQKNKNYKEIKLEDLSNFVGWLRNPYGNSKVVSIENIKSKRSEKTINLNITVVIGFYDYLFRTEFLDVDLLKNIFKKDYNTKINYKSFLHHINKSNAVNKNILKVKEPKKKIRPLTKEQVRQLYRACSNFRDKFLIKLLLETGLRIGEALSLHINDFIDSRNHKEVKGHKLILKDRGELPNNAYMKSGERQIFISQDLFDEYDNYIYKLLEEYDIDTDFLFVKLSGRNIGNPLEYQNISSLFRRLNKKLNFDVNPHLLRHTHATIFYLQTNNIKALQERLGHSDVQTTINMYVHLSEDELRKNWKNAEPFFKDFIGYLDVKKG